MSTEQDSARRLAEADAHALRALAEAWAEEHDLHDSVGAFEAGWEARQPIIDSLTAERDDARGHVAYWQERWRIEDGERRVAQAGVKRLREALDGAYRERAQMAVALARLFPSWVNIDPEEPDWPVLYVQLPTGQASWHFSPTDRDLLDGITVGGPAWDGHTTEEKYALLAAVATPPSEGGQSNG